MDKKEKILEESKLDTAYQKIIHYFFSFPKIEIGLNELSSTLKISKTNTNKIVSHLKEINFLDIKYYGRVWRITCNKENILNRTTKVSRNLEEIYKIYYNFLKQKILEVSNPLCVIFFGSCSKGNDTEKSDIDIAVEINANEEIKTREYEIENFFYRENIKANVLFFSKKYIDKNLYTNIINGIVLEGFLEL